MTEQARPEIGRADVSPLAAVAAWATVQDSPVKWREAIDAVRALDTTNGDAVEVLLAEAEGTIDDKSRIDALARLRAALESCRPLDVKPPDLTAPALTWLIPDWLPAGRVALFSGQGGEGKSRLALALAEGMAAGRAEWLEGEPSRMRELTMQANVVYTTWEESPRRSGRAPPRALPRAQPLASGWRQLRADCLWSGAYGAPAPGGHGGLWSAVGTDGRHAPCFNNGQ